MKSKLCLGLWTLVSFIVPFLLALVAISLGSNTFFIIVLVAAVGNLCAFGFHLVKYCFYGIPVKRLEHKQSYRVLEQERTKIDKDGKTEYDFHLTLVNLNDNKTRLYWLESHIPIFNEKGNKLEEFPAAFKLIKVREYGSMSEEPGYRTLYHVLEIHCP